MSSCDSHTFMKFYGNNKNKQTCHGNSNIGSAYVCPKPSVGGPIIEQQSRGDPKCGVPVPNMGRVAHCPVSQQGGSANLTYSATGELNKSKGCGCQKGGSGKQVHHNDSPKYPRNTCKHGNSSKCTYPNYNGAKQYGRDATHVTGYYMDLTAQPIGNRPVHGVHDNYNHYPNTMNPKKDKGNVLDRRFDCQQPYWGEKCL